MRRVKGWVDVKIFVFCELIAIIRFFVFSPPMKLVLFTLEKIRVNNHSWYGKTERFFDLLNHF